MSSISRPAVRPWHRRLVLAFVALLALAPALLAPPASRADTDLAIGGVAIIADADGDDVRLRDDVGYDAGVIGLYPEGTAVDILDGPFAAGDGSVWYAVAIDGVGGYMVADYLSADGSAGGDTLVVDDVNLRAGPSTADEILAVLLPGESVTITGGASNGFYPVVAGGVSGWVYGAYLDGFGAASVEGPTTTVREALNLRAAPSTGAAVLTVMPAGAAVVLTGGDDGGFLSVSYNGLAGWAAADYLGEGSGDGGGAAIGVAVATSDLNLRAGPGTGSAVLAVMPPGAAVELLGDPDGGFYPVRFDGQAGWAAGDYLDLDGDGGGSSGGGAIAWPVSGGEWEITQGYNGPYSHYNAGALYQYHYSFDIARTDGSSAGQPVYAPASGTIRWTETATGGMSIDLGNGYAVAFFHVTLDPGLTWGQPISQGQYVGTVSGPGGDGYVGFAHVHLTVWQTDDGGNWSRNAVPFSGANAIAGVDFPDTGGGNQYAGTVFYP